MHLVSTGMSIHLLLHCFESNTNIMHIMLAIEAKEGELCL